MAITNKVRLNHAPAFVGMVADLQLVNRVSRLNNTATVIPYGTAVEADATEGTVKPFVSGKFVGILIREMVDVTYDGKNFGLNPNQTGTFMTDGVIWVTAGETVAIGDDVFIGTGNDVKGMFTKQAGSSGTLAVALPNAKFLTAGNKGDLVRIKVTIGG